MPNSAEHLQLKRAYAPPEPTDGTRVLVDRIWPRGLTKEKAALDLWLKEVAPSPALRKWFGHEPSRFGPFAEKYRAELAKNEAALAPLLEALRAGPVTLVYAAHDEAHNHAVVLKAHLECHLDAGKDAIP